MAAQLEAVARQSSARSCSRSRTICARRSRRSAATRRRSPTAPSTTPIPTTRKRAATSSAPRPPPRTARPRPPRPLPARQPPVLAQPAPVRRRRVVRDAAEAFAPQAHELGIELTRRRRRTPFPVELDPERLAQIVANLVENALKYATARSRCTRRRRPTAASRSWSPTTAPASRPTDIAHVFERLYTVRATPGRSVGTGLGLAIVRELAAAMGGTAVVEAPGPAAPASSSRSRSARTPRRTRSRITPRRFRPCASLRMDRLAARQHLDELLDPTRVPRLAPPSRRWYNTA